MESRTRPIACCLFAIAAVAAAPACLAQQAPAQAPVAAPPMDAPAPAGDDAAGGQVPRSAFGKVMSVLISALQQNAEGRSAPSPDAAAGLPAASPAPAPARDIQVSAAFLPAPAGKAVPATPATASID